jgi:TRAP-type C4-dicarboxylate transport system permease small subunit
MERMMSKTVHRIYIGVFVLLVLLAFFALVYYGTSYYNTTIEERFYHPDHAMLKPSGALGHGLGIIGTFLILFGVFSYMARKRMKSLRTFGILKYWLEFHIFLCTLGPIMVLFHTAFKFGGIVSVSFWSMVGVVLSGVIGRFIYIQIPRTIEGRELSLGEVRDLKVNIGTVLQQSYSLNETSLQEIIASTQYATSATGGGPGGGMFRKYMRDRNTIRKLKSVIKAQNLTRTESKKLVDLVKHELSLNNKIDRLMTMQKLFKYWHVAHLPFAIIMLIIMIIHVVITLTFGYRWIF